MALADLTTTQLTQLSPSAGIPAQVINAELLRRSQSTNAAGAYGTKMPALANAQTNPSILAQGGIGSVGAPGMPMAEASNQDMSYLRRLERSLAAPGAVPGQPQPMMPGAQSPPPPTTGGNSNAFLLNLLNSAGSDRAPVTDITNLSGMPMPETAMPPYDPTSSRLAASLSEGFSTRPPIDLSPIQADYKKYARQVADELPDNTGELRAALKEEKATAARQRGNAFGQGLMSAGLSMLGSREPYFQALGRAGQQGLQEYSSQRDAADRHVQQNLTNEAQLGAADQQRQVAIMAGGTQRALGDVQAQQDSQKNELAKYNLQNVAGMGRLQAAMLSAQNNANTPQARLAQIQLTKADSMINALMAQPMILQQQATAAGMTVPQYVNAIYDNAMREAQHIMRGGGGTGIGILPTTTPPAATLRPGQ